MWVIVAAAVVILLALRLAARSFWAERADYVRTPPQAISRHPERTGIAGLAEISLADRNGHRLAGWYAPSRNRAAIVLAHGTGSDRSALLFETEFLAAAGFGVLAIDLPGQGASEGRTRWGVPERQAIGAAVDWLSARADVDPQRIGGFGSSMGAYVMTQAAVLDPRLSSVTLAASPNDVVAQNWLASDRWGLLTQIPNYLALRAYGQSLDMKPVDVIAKIAPRPVFIVGGELDDVVPKFMALQLFAAAREPKQLWIVPGAHHGDYEQIAADQYSTRVIGFFERTLLEPTRTLMEPSTLRAAPKQPIGDR
jgi:dipeptidyl aminopeptidase/acylaminoacyl peptidase